VFGCRKAEPLELRTTGSKSGDRDAVPNRQRRVSSLLQKTETGWLSELETLQKLAIWPKLYRRLLAYFKDRNAGLAGFDAWLRGSAVRDDKLWIISEARAAHLHNVVKVSRNKFSMTYLPEDLVIAPR
jgi:hypothetical protein